VKVGDLVKRNPEHNEVHDYGIGLIVSKLEKNPFIDYSSDEYIEKRWAVLWTNPLWTMDNGWSVQYEMELEIINEACER
tara:strand:+ start:149 stop:385 length:237 start_codon:yes stop_codon:yes gene_type:complete